MFANSPRLGHLMMALTLNPSTTSYIQKQILQVLTRHPVGSGLRLFVKPDVKPAATAAPQAAIENALKLCVPNRGKRVFWQRVCVCACVRARVSVRVCVRVCVWFACSRCVRACARAFFACYRVPTTSRVTLLARACVFVHTPACVNTGEMIARGHALPTSLTAGDLLMLHDVMV